MEHTWKTLISCIERGGKYTGRNVTKNHGRPYLLSSRYEINLLANSMQNRLGLRYTMILINCHRQTHGNNAVCRPTVNLAFEILQPKITYIYKIQQGTKNEGKWKEGFALNLQADLFHNETIEGKVYHDFLLHFFLCT